MPLGLRIPVFIFFVFGIYFLPWWFLFSAVFVLMLFYRVLLYELLVPVLLMDFIYGISIERFYGFQFVASLIFVGVLFIVYIVKKHFRV